MLATTSLYGWQGVSQKRNSRKLGFVLEGRLRDDVFTNGSWRVSLLYAILVSEWHPYRS